MSDQNNTDGISLEVKADGAAARASDQALNRIGQAAAWLMPRRAARVQITAALAERVAEKIRAGSPLNEAEMFFVGQFFEKEARLLANRESAAEEIHRVLPEVNDRLKEHPPAAQTAPSQSFIDRAEGIASEVSEEEIRQLFARLVAGEICRPGSFSLRTLEAIRVLDARTARTFDALCRFVIDRDTVISEGEVSKFLSDHGISFKEFFDLQEAGLIQHETTIGVKKGEAFLSEYGQRQLRTIIEQEKKFKPKIWISIYRLTRIGRELAAVLPFNPNYDYFDVVSTAIATKVGDLGIVEHAAVGSEEWTRVETTKAG